ncbi:hypothetical protein GCM10020256_38600 [Streptomyces thermocoprophilus]
MRKKTIAAAALLAAASLTLSACDSGGDSAADPVSVVSEETDSGKTATVLDKPFEKPDLVLTDTHGKQYDFRKETQGRPTLIYFGYTHCPDVCPLTMNNLAVAKKKLPRADQDKLRIVFVTTDPERDTPAALGAWLKGIDPPGRRPHRRLRHHPGRRPHPGHLHRRAVQGQERQGRLHARHAGHRVLPEDRRRLCAVRQGRHRRRLRPRPPADHQGGEPVRRTAALTAAALTGALLLTGCGSGDDDAKAELSVSGAYMPQPVSDMAAGFLTVANDGGAADRLTSVTSDAAGSVTLHETSGGAMRETTSMEVPAHGKLVLSSGGNHLMFEMLKRKPKQGETVDVELHFAESGTVKVAIPVKPATYRPADGH